MIGFWKKTNQYGEVIQEIVGYYITGIPNNLREYACIDKDVVSVGVLSRVEIWSKDKWLENGDYDDMDEIAEHMAELGFGI